MKKNKLTIVVFSSLAITVASFFVAGYIAGHLLPYQDSSPELLKQHNEYVKIYTPIWYVLLIIFLSHLSSLLLA